MSTDTGTLFEPTNHSMPALPVEATTLQIAIDKIRRMERQQDSHKKPKLIGTHEQLQKNDAQTNAVKTPIVAMIKSVNVIR
jgi:hypothetical protein